MTTIGFTPHGWEEYLYWQKQNRKILKRVNALIADCCRSPYDGLGKPEPLRHELAGYWSRRIDNTHRLVYGYLEQKDMLLIIHCRYHYQ